MADAGTRGDVYGTSTVKRIRRTKAQLAAIDAAIVTVLQEEHPATVRSVFYRVTSMGMVDKTEAGYKLIGRQLLKLRRNELVPYHWITDGTRYVMKPDTYSGAAYALELTARYYRRQVWANQAVRVHMFSEKDALQGVISPITDRWDVPLGILRGYPSETFVYEVAASLSPVLETFLYQLGDHDPSGVDAWRSFEQKVREFNPTALVQFKRLAVTPQQMEEMNLPTRPTKKTDSRSKDFLGGSVEVDAIPPSKLREIVETAITAHLNWDAYEAMKNIEREEQRQLTAISKALPGALGHDL
ncbi:MAG: hypothetical protein PGN24_03725 [Microbacterium arborescens]